MNVCLLILTNYRKERRLGKMGFRAGERHTPRNVHQVHYVHSNVHRPSGCEPTFCVLLVETNRVNQEKGYDYVSDYARVENFQTIARVALRGAFDVHNGQPRWSEKGQDLMEPKSYGTTSQTQ